MFYNLLRFSLIKMEAGPTKAPAESQDHFRDRLIGDLMHIHNNLFNYKF